MIVLQKLFAVQLFQDNFEMCIAKKFMLQVAPFNGFQQRRICSALNGFGESTPQHYCLIDCCLDQAFEKTDFPDNADNPEAR